MKISTKSLHYRWYRFLNQDDLPKDLCNYFWGFVFLNLLALFAFCVGLVLLSPILLFFITDESNFFPFAKIGLLIDGVILSFATVIAVSNMTLLKEYLKAFKGKFCPKIEFTE